QVPAGGERGRGERLGADLRIGVEARARMLRRTRDQRDVLGSVNQRELLGGREARVDLDEAVAPILRHELANGADALRTLGMAGAGVVRLVAAIENDAGLHAHDYSLVDRRPEPD